MLVYRQRKKRRKKILYPCRGFYLNKDTLILTLWHGQKGRVYMNIGMIAHDAKKKLMQNFCIAYRAILAKNEVYATGTTGRLIEEVDRKSVV